MKRIILAFLLAMAFGPLTQAKTRTVTELDSLGHTRRVIELSDTTIQGVKQTDTLSITTYLDEAEASSSRRARAKMDLRPGRSVQEMEVAIIAILCVFLAPALVILFYLYFRYKNRQHRYRLMEQALASGQPLPAEMLQQAKGAKQVEVDGNLAKGVKNACLGVGLFIFLWALTDEFGLACVGLLIMFIGFGQIIIHYLTQQSQAPWKHRDDNHRNNSLPTPTEEA